MLAINSKHFYTVDFDFCFSDFILSGLAIYNVPATHQCRNMSDGSESEHKNIKLSQTFSLSETCQLKKHVQKFDCFHISLNTGNDAVTRQMRRFFNIFQLQLSDM
jgi:hypothetical protein